MNLETKLMHEIMVALSQHDCVVHRTNSGVFYTKDGRAVRIGVEGMTDLIGHRPDGKIFYIEVKYKTGVVRKEQQTFINAMQKSGAIAGVARSIEEALRIVRTG